MYIIEPKAVSYLIEATIENITERFALCPCGGLLSYHHNWYDTRWYICDSCSKETALNDEAFA